MKKIWYGDIVLPNALLKKGQITVENGKIIYVGEKKLEENVPNENIIIWEKGYILPGLIDIHVHGAGGYDVMDGNEQAISNVAKTLLQNGVIGYLATTLTSDMDHLNKILVLISEHKSTRGEAEIFGIHLEGPWISSEYKGAHNSNYIVFPHKGEGKRLYDIARGKLKIVTLAPEIPNAIEMIRELVDLGVIVSIGHSGASSAEVIKAVQSGASNVTHFYNAMKGFNHREIGVVGSLLLDDSLYYELIADGHHVDPKAIKLLVKLKGIDKIILVSDNIRAMGMASGEYQLGGLKIFVSNGKAVLDNGKLAGSVVPLMSSVINMLKFTDISIWDAVKMASLNPAKRLGLDKEVGSIEVGKRAHLVAIYQDGRTNQVWLNGKEQLKR